MVTGSEFVFLRFDKFPCLFFSQSAEFQLLFIEFNNIS